MRIPATSAWRKISVKVPNGLMRPPPAGRGRCKPQNADECWIRQRDAWDADYGGMAPVEARAVADAARSSAPFSQPFEMQREKITRFCNRVLGCCGIRRIPLPLAAGILE